MKNITNNKKYTIAYFEQELNSVKSSRLWTEIVKTANEVGINIITFYGDVLGKSEYNIAYQLCNIKKFDGIISWASTDNEFLDYYEKFKGIPFLSMSLKFGGLPYVSIDCYSGMKEALIHLIKVHNIKKIAFIRGPETHLYAQERYQAYLDIHNEFNLELDEKRITPCGTWSQDYGSKGIKTLFTERKLELKKDIEAIACVNDYFAISAIEELKKFGIRTPKDIAVIGFNNSQDAVSYSPPITSVDMPHDKQGALSVKTIVSMIKGEKYNIENDLYSNLVIHRSCGCKSILVKNIISEKIDENNGKNQKFFARFKKNIKSNNRNDFFTFKDQKDVIINLITEEFFKLAGNDKIEKDLFFSLIEKFIDSFINSLEKNSNEEFINILEETLVFIAEHDINIELWHEVISVLRSNFFKYKYDKEKEALAHDYLEQARVVISEIIKRNDINKNLLNNKKIEAIRNLGSKLIKTFNLENTLETLYSGLKEIGFPGFYLVLYEKIISYKFPNPVPEKSNLVLAYNLFDNINIKGGSINFLTEDILPIDIIPKNRNFIFFLIPLIFEKKHIGYIILEIGPIDKYIYSFLAEQLSSSLMGAILMEEKIKEEKILEETLENLKNKAKIITDHSEQINNNVGEVSTAMEEMANNIREISSRAEEVMGIVKSAVEMAKNASMIINNLNENSKKISQITNIINDIAGKTNILALNANIEAARAGGSGKGFKIVSMEIKKLSNLTVKSTKDINTLLTTIQNGSNDTYKVIDDIVNIINNISNFSFIIKEAVSQQTLAANSVSQQLINASNGSKEIFEAIKEVAYTENKLKKINN